MPTNLSQNLNSRVGCHCWGTSPDSVAGIPTYASSGCRWMRATRPMQMDVLTTGRPGQYDFSRGEQSINDAISHGMSVMGILDGRWGNETLTNALPWASPIWEHLDLWRDFVTQTVEHYRDRVQYWEIINEPPFFWWYPVPEGVTIPEQGADLKRAPIWAYAALLKTSAEAIRAADPDARIVCGAGFPDGYFLEQLYRHGSRGDFDIVGVHYLQCDHPSGFKNGLQSIRNVMERHGDGKKPVWDTENGPGGALIGHAVESTSEYEGLYSIYRHCFAHEFGLDRYFWFNAEPPHPAAPDQRDVAYQALRVLHDRTGEGGLLRFRHFGDEVHAYVFDGLRGPVTIVWSTAPATVHAAGSYAGATYLGEPCQFENTLPVTGRPLYIGGDVMDDLRVAVTGPSDLTRPPMKQPDSHTPTIAATRSAQSPVDWSSVPPAVARRPLMPSELQIEHFCRVPTAVPGAVQIAYDDEMLWIRAETFDNHPSQPAALVQFTIRDSNPPVPQWPLYSNGYCLINLFARHSTACVIRLETINPDTLPSRIMNEIDLETQDSNEGIILTVGIPWKELGPCRPGLHNPFLMLFTFSRADNLLDVPEDGRPEQWNNNFGDTFVVRTPSAMRWVTFAG